MLELPVPASDVAIWPALQEAGHDFLGYLISFAFIGGIWLTHAGLTQGHAARRLRRVQLQNLLLLLFVALLPFSTSLMVTHLDALDVGMGVLFYGLNVLLASLTLSFLLFYVAEPGLAVDDIADERLERMYRQRWMERSL